MSCRQTTDSKEVSVIRKCVHFTLQDKTPIPQTKLLQTNAQRAITSFCALPGLQPFSKAHLVCKSDQPQPAVEPATTTARSTSTRGTSLGIHPMDDLGLPICRHHIASATVVTSGEAVEGAVEERDRMAKWVRPIGGQGLGGRNRSQERVMFWRSIRYLWHFYPSMFYIFGSDGIGVLLHPKSRGKKHKVYLSLHIYKYILYCILYTYIYCIHIYIIQIYYILYTHILLDPPNCSRKWDLTP